MKKIIILLMCILLVGCNVFKNDFEDDNLNAGIKRTLRNLNTNSYEAIKHLDLSFRDIENLKGIEALTNLESLNISNNRISDLSPLESLEKLEILDLQNNLVEDLKPISGLENLQVLLIRNNPIASLNNVQNLYNQLVTTDFLIEVTFGDENFEQYIRNTIDKEDGKITFFDLEKIRSLELDGKGIEDLSGIAYMTNLEKISLSEPMVHIEEISKLQHLKHVEISNNALNDLSIFSNSDNISYLKVNNNKIKSVEALESLKKIEYLDLTYNEISNLSPLSQMPLLETLLVKGNPIYDYDEIEDLLGDLEKTDIIIVYFNDPQLDLAVKDQLNKSSGVLTDKNLKSIKNLQAKGYDISRLEGIELLENLVSIDISQNQISDLSPLQEIADLTIIKASDNMIEELQPLVYLKNLEILDLKNNQISNVGPLLFLENLEYLYLENNPIEESQFKDDLLDQVPYTDNF